MEPRGTNMSGIPPTDGMAPSPEPQILTRKSLAEAKRKREQEGILFPLRMTGGYARITIPSLVDKTFLDQLPRSIQQMISDQLANETLAVRKQKQDAVAEMTKEQRYQEFMDLVTVQDELAQRAMVLCWIQPRVVLTEAELPPDDDDVIVASDVHADDRLEFVGVLFGGEQEAVKTLERFRREQMAVLSPEPPVETAAAPVSDPEPAGSAIA